MPSTSTSPRCTDASSISAEADHRGVRGFQLTRDESGHVQGYELASGDARCKGQLRRQRHGLEALQYELAMPSKIARMMCPRSSGLAGRSPVHAIPRSVEVRVVAALKPIRLGTVISVSRGDSLVSLAMDEPGEARGTSSGDGRSAVAWDVGRVDRPHDRQLGKLDLIVQSSQRCCPRPPSSATLSLKLASCSRPRNG